MGSRDPLSPMENFPYLLEHVSTWIDTRMYTSLCKERGAKPWPNSRVNAKLKHRLFVEAGIHSVLSPHLSFTDGTLDGMETTKQLCLCGQLSLPLFCHPMENSNFSRRDPEWKRWKNNEWLLSNGIISESR